MKALFLDDCNDCIAFMAVGMECAWWEGGRSVESDVQLVVKEIQEVAVDFRKLFPSIEGWDVVCGVRGHGSIHCACKKADC